MYTPNTWSTGDIITAEKLNNLEQGVAGAGAAATTAQADRKSVV